ncbi:DUF4321 domain-containing protein [Defluviitalea phaphyphila]|uniref:DUF4321 domain-containing protein n=1 Tax=Defluviitalea phaphyphila TaxID=1473580 RepID=UPI000A85F5B8|nr:DUF4321 domain-containing protein [Defluviitalea phaphyphila]
MYGGKDKNSWALFLLLLGGIVLGGFIGHYLGQVPYMQWINYGKEFGLKNPLTLDLDILYIQFSITIEFTIASILGIIAAILIYRKL